MLNNSRVIAGDYENCKVGGYNKNGAFLIKGFETTPLNKYNVEMYEVLSEEKIKSGTSAILRGGMGAMLLGPVGLLAGLSAKSKSMHVVAVVFKDGKQSLMEMNDVVYKAFLQGMFKK